MNVLFSKHVAVVSISHCVFKWAIDEMALRTGEPALEKICGRLRIDWRSAFITHVLQIPGNM